MTNYRRQILPFLAIGMLSAAIDAGVFALLVALGMHPVWASVIGFLSAFVVNYSGNRQVVFRAAHTHGAFWRYVALVGLNLVLSAGIVALGLQIGMVPIAAKLVSMVFVAALNFAAMRLWVFRKQTLQ